MALSGRRGQRFTTTNVWPGFVDAMGALLMVLIFVLSIFMMVQSMLRDTITTKDHELDALSAQVAGLAQALSLEQAKTETLTGRLDAAGARITAFEAQVAGLLADKAAQEAVISSLQGNLKTSDEALAAARLQLEEARKKAEETLTLLAAAEAAKKDLQGKLDVQLSEAEKQAALKAVAEKTLTETRAEGDRKAEQVTLLNQQVAALRTQLADLQAVLDAAKAKDADAKVQVEALGSQLNSALAQVAAEQKRRAALEEEARKKAEADNAAKTQK